MSIDRPIDLTDASFVPNAPDDLSSWARAKHEEIVAAYPAGYWDRANAELLVEYVRALDMARALSIRIDACVAACGEVDELARLLNLRDREVRRAKALAVTMRMTQQSIDTRSVATKRLNPGLGSSPWDDELGADDLRGLDS